MKSTNGVERVLSQRLSMLAECNQYEVYLITYNQYGAPFSFPISDKVHYFDLATRYIEHCSYHGLYQFWDRYVSGLKYRRLFHQYIDKIKPDVVTCVDTHLADLEAVLSLKTDIIKVVECHCGFSAYFSDLCKITNPYKRYRERTIKEKLIRTIRKFDKIVVMTDEEKREWNLEGKVVSIPNMLASYQTESSRKNEVNYRVISVGRYSYQKGYDMLIEAWKIVQSKHPNWSLHIYGSHDGDMGDYDHLVQIIEKTCLDQVFLHPAINDVYPRYCESDFLVVSSRFESFGLVMIEAMSCGLPVVAFDCNYGPRTIVSDGETGILVPSSDVKQLAESISFMIENVDERTRMGDNSLVTVAKYKPERIFSIWQEFYQTL